MVVLLVLAWLRQLALRWRRRRRQKQRQRNKQVIPNPPTNLTSTLDLVRCHKGQLRQWSAQVAAHEVHKLVCAHIAFKRHLALCEHSSGRLHEETAMARCECRHGCEFMFLASETKNITFLGKPSPKSGVLLIYVVYLPTLNCR